MKIFPHLTLTTLLLFSGCSQLTLEEKNEQKSAIDLMAYETIKALIKENPAIQKELDNAKGYGVVNWKVTKVPIIGAGSGNGVIVDFRNNKRTYIDVSRFDVGGGWGVRSYKNLLITTNDAILDDALDGNIKFKAGAEVSAGTLEASRKPSSDKVTSHTLFDGGGSATATVRVLHSTVNSDLTD